MHSNVTIKNVSWTHFSWAILYTSYILNHTRETAKITNENLVVEHIVTTRREQIKS